MPIGAYTDKNHSPNTEEIQAGLGSQWQTWQAFNQFVANTYRCKSELKFYGKNYGWAMRYRKNGRALLSLYPGRDCFTVQIILSEAEIAQARQTNLGQAAIRAIEAANPYPEGRWLFITIQSNQHLQDVQNMLAIKVLSGNPKK